MQNLSLHALTLSTAIVISLAGCRDAPPAPQSGSGLSSFEVQLPVVTDPVKKPLVTGYQLIVKPIAAISSSSSAAAASTDCTNKSLVQDYSVSTISDVKLKATCDYEVTLSLGTLSADKSKLDTVIYSNIDLTTSKPSTIIKKEAMTGKTKIEVNIQVFAVDGSGGSLSAGNAIGGGSSTDTDLQIKVSIKDNAAPNNLPTNSPSPNPSQSPAPAPVPTISPAISTTPAR